VHYLMLSCKKETELNEKKSVLGLGWKENMQLKIHTKMCAACTNYQRQSKDIDCILEKHVQDEEATPLLENQKIKGKYIAQPRKIGEPDNRIIALSGQLLFSVKFDITTGDLEQGLTKLF
jgi:hypothetical protein